ncbi:hypothetical protein ACWEJ6_31115 [Nonomuraea sp. NPDC004702]
MSYQYGPPQGSPRGGYPPQGPPGPPYGPGGYGFPPPQPPPHRRKNNYTGLKVAAGIVGGIVVFLIVIGVIGAALGGASERGRERLTVAEHTPATAESQEPAADSETPADATPTPSPTPTAVKPRTYRGVGDKVIKVRETEDILLATLTHQGTSNFIVNPLDPGGAEQATIVNEIGNYRGTILVNEENGKVLRGFKIKADGAWTLTLKPLVMARQWTNARVSGRGDDVLLLSPASSGLTTVKVNHSGSSNFIVHSYSEGSGEGLINEIGSYRGEVLLPDGTLLVTIQADGRWTFTKS